LSQILRGICEGIDGADTADAWLVATALERSVVVAFQAVRKPVEGTILTVLRDSADAARAAADDAEQLPEALRRVSAAAFDSVRRTPELLPVLRENGVVDAGGFGLAILIEGFVAAALGERVAIADVSVATGQPLHVELANDWEDQKYLYCTEFLFFTKDVSSDDIYKYVSSVGGSELVVGSGGEYKVHVHTNDPGAVLAHMTALGEVAEVHVNNMRRQTAERDASLAASRSAPVLDEGPLKPIGFVAVAAGDGIAKILTSLGVDVVVSGGQTMNPSTQDIADAIERIRAVKVVVLPNNKNIVMAANAAASVASKPVAVVATTAVPQAFSAMLAYDGSDDIDAVAAAMMQAADGVRAGEVTTAIKDAKAKVGKIRCGQVIGIADHEIEVVGDDVARVASDLADHLLAHGAETLMLLTGEDLTDEVMASVAAEIGKRHPQVEIETHRGDQPLYPVLMAAE
jgi:DAK2 domain fusion protein YloV